MAEKLVLVFANGKRFEWNTGKGRHSMKAIRLQRKFGDPIEILGSGKVAQTLRQKYVVYRSDPDHYKPDVVGTASHLGGAPKEVAKQTYDRLKKVLRVKSE